MKNKKSKTKDLIESLQHLSIKPPNRRQNRQRITNFFLSVKLPVPHETHRKHRPCFTDDMMTVFSLDNEINQKDKLNPDQNIHINLLSRSDSMLRLQFNRDQYSSSVGVLHTSNCPDPQSNNDPHFVQAHKRYSSILNEPSDLISYSRSFSCFASELSSSSRPYNTELNRRQINRLDSIDFNKLQRVANIYQNADFFKFNYSKLNIKDRTKNYSIKDSTNLTDFNQLIDKSYQKNLITKDNESIIQTAKASWRSRRCSDPQHWQTHITNRIQRNPEEYSKVSYGVNAKSSEFSQEDKDSANLNKDVKNVLDSKFDKNHDFLTHGDPSNQLDESSDKVLENDVTVNELASYMEHSLYFPGQLSEMAQRMYL